MAWTTTKKAQHAVGNLYVQLWELTADSATLELSTGLKNVLLAQSTSKSAPATNAVVSANELSAGTASYGHVSLTGVTSGNEYYLVVYGN